MMMMMMAMAYNVVYSEGMLSTCINKLISLLHIAALYRVCLRLNVLDFLIFLREELMLSVSFDGIDDIIMK